MARGMPLRLYGVTSPAFLSVVALRGTSGRAARRRAVLTFKVSLLWISLRRVCSARRRTSSRVHTGGNRPRICRLATSPRDPHITTSPQQEENAMVWTTPRIVEVCVGMEVTSYESAEL
jgi:coenzyme PQQ precursor peptide PqqA